MTFYQNYHHFLPTRFGRNGLHKLAISLLLSSLMACGGKTGDVSGDFDACAPFEGLTPVCGFQSPEDLALLPDDSGILVSEFGQMGETEGVISVLNLSNRQRTVLYSADSSNDLRVNNAIWGDAKCDEPEQFSPHGIDLAQRPGGRWQLLVVNHGGRESIEMFELLQSGDQPWSLIWRGCVEAPDDSAFNDVAALSNGFVTTRMMSRDSGIGGMIDYFLGRDTGFLWQWNLNDGFTKVRNSEGVMPNGVVADITGTTVYLNIYGEDHLRILDRTTGTIIRELSIRSADNTNWDKGRPGKLLVASHEFDMLDMLSCMGDGKANCSAEFDIIEVDSDDFSQQLLFRSDGNFYGAGTAALRVGDELYIGSFTGQRILIAPVGYGVE